MILRGYPSIAQTYMTVEVDAVRNDYDLRIVNFEIPANIPVKKHHPFIEVDRPEGIRETIQEFKPQVIHTHYVHMTPMVAQLAEAAGIPFTTRTHSYETFDYVRKPSLPPPLNVFRGFARSVNTDSCLGVLVLPFLRPHLERMGVRSDKLIDYNPGIHFKKFYDASPNGDAILNVGACVPKKKMKDFVELGQWVKKPLNLYAVGHNAAALRKYNEELGSPVHIPDPAQPEEMPGIYKRHAWMVYTGCPKINTVGWPMAVSEAQASGCGVCFPNLRPDLKDYIGEAGFLYDSIREVPDLISKPFPQELRAKGFEQARKFDVEVTIKLLTNLWDRAVRSPPNIRKWKSYSLYRKAVQPVKLVAPGLRKLFN